MIGSLVKTSARAFGVDIVKFPQSAPLAAHLKEFFRHNKIELVLDVGACDGGFCRLLRNEVRYSGSIVSFEPCSKSFETLSHRMKSDNSWKGYQIGLSDSNSDSILNTYGARPDFNSVLQLRERDAQLYDVDLSTRGAESIALRCLDTLWDEFIDDAHTSRVFLKTDTQGHDAAVVRGARDHLKNILGIQSEIPTIEIYDGMPSMPECLKLYSSLGYIPIGFYPVNRPVSYNGASPEFDVLFQQKALHRPT